MSLSEHVTSGGNLGMQEEVGERGEKCDPTPSRECETWRDESDDRSCTGDTETQHGRDQKPPPEAEEEEWDTIFLTLLIHLGQPPVCLHDCDAGSEPGILLQVPATLRILLAYPRLSRILLFAYRMHQGLLIAHSCRMLFLAAGKMQMRITAKSITANQAQPSSAFSSGMINDRVLVLNIETDRWVCLRLVGSVVTRHATS